MPFKWEIVVWRYEGNYVPESEENGLQKITSLFYRGFRVLPSYWLYDLFLYLFSRKYNTKTKSCTE